MKTLRIDFLLPAPVPVWALVLCTTLIAALLTSLAWVWSARTDNLELTLRLANARKTYQELAAASQDISPFVQPLPPYEMDARRALEEAKFVTAQALSDLESVQVLNVLPSSVELSPEFRAASIEIEFSDPSNLLEFLRKLNTAEPVHRWQILRATTKEQGQALGTAVIEARW